ncbi:MAG: fumarylacetoacetate hydrolase family protein [Candidatus Binatia bacterium]|nr:fumarylacetoacetate hydrolase family protein [Candidatus Binatia bacterium]
MKILRFDNDKIGILREGGNVLDVSDVVSHRDQKGPQRVIEEVITNFEDCRGEIERIAGREEGIPLGSVRLLAPIPRPSKCLGAFLNYVDMGRTRDMLPLEFFYMDPALLGPGGTIELVEIPEITEFQPEAELAFVMGKTAKNVSVDEAMDHVFGYVPFFDISVRGITRYTRFLTKGQASHGPCGPWITTKDELSDPHNVNVKSWVNGEIAQNYNTEYMAHKIPAQVAWLSRFIQLEPGDVIATGTYHEGRKPIKDGDLLEIEIEGIGKTEFHAKGYSPTREAPSSAPTGPRPSPGPADSNKITWV